jgi:Domain of unknown function (DUF1937)
MSPDKEKFILFPRPDLAGKFIYLASPYTHPDNIVRETRFLEAVRAAACLFNQRQISNFSPVAYTHSIAVRYGLPAEWEFWADYDTTMISLAAELWVLCLPGYSQSMGVQTELKIARKLGKPIMWMVPWSDGFYCWYADDPIEETLYGKITEGRLASEKVGDV